MTTQTLFACLPIEVVVIVLAYAVNDPECRLMARRVVNMTSLLRCLDFRIGNSSSAQYFLSMSVDDELKEYFYTFLMKNSTVECIMSTSAVPQTIRENFFEYLVILAGNAEYRLSNYPSTSTKIDFANCIERIEKAVSLGAQPIICRRDIFVTPQFQATETRQLLEKLKYKV